ncbi:hypothetical protein FPZ49_20160 [Paenibacillus cremeus]|uniref:Uncharacterized protein n=1 Tax=Paenibacillus cremeus TaxID=2163881 RepID=A0A559K7X1_9BACL|nr:hypothetical protein FPZ49_20160 [Paenibacillus cremeus]
MEGNYDRPGVVSFFAVLMIISGVVLLVTQLLAVSQLNKASELIGVTNSFFQAAISFLGLLGIIGGVGMWFGKKWGWWAVGINYVKYGLRTLWNGFLLFYMFRENVLSFFNTTETIKWKALLIVFIMCILIFVLGTFFKTI